MELRLGMQHKQSLSQKMQLSVKILQMNAMELNQFITEAALENPLLELEPPTLEEEEQLARLKKLEWLESMDESGGIRNSYHYEPEESEQPLYERKATPCLEEVLLLQLPALRLPLAQEQIVRYLIANLDESGYMTIPLIQLQEELGATQTALEGALAQLQCLEPAGVGARDLKECLLLQVHRSASATPLLIKLIEKHLELLAKNQLDSLSKALGISIDEVKALRDQLLELNPKPGNGYCRSNAIEYISPDIFVVQHESGLAVSINSYHQPQIQISNYYSSLAQEPDSELNRYLIERRKKAEWIISCIQQRNDTLLACAENILQRQECFFKNGPGHLAPMSLADIATQMDLHPSTISRAIRGKYLQCQWGVFALGDFFSRAVTTKEQSSDNVINQIRRIIADENPTKPFSDQQISDRLQELDIQISRRTVTKYRDIEKIPSASQRKKF